MGGLGRVGLLGTATSIVALIAGWNTVPLDRSRSVETWRLDPVISSLPPPAASSLQVPRPTALQQRYSTTWAPIRRPVVARAEPSARARSVAFLSSTTPEGTANIAVVRGVTRSGGRLWVRLSLAVLPNGTQGWVPRSVLGGYTVVDTRLVVSLRLLRATLYRADRRILSVPLGVGTRFSPTPTGTFYIRDEFTSYASPFYGPIAFGTSARSTALTDWPAGGFIGIHGTDRPDLIPGRISHGCLRLRNSDILRLARVLAVGSPVVINR